MPNLSFLSLPPDYPAFTSSISPDYPALSFLSFSPDYPAFPSSYSAGSPPAFPSSCSAECHPAFIYSCSTLFCAREFRERVAIAFSPSWSCAATSDGAFLPVVHCAGCHPAFHLFPPPRFPASPSPRFSSTYTPSISPLSYIGIVVCD